MEVIKGTKSEEAKEKKPTYLLIIVGVESLGRQFLLEALTQIINLSGYSVNLSEEEAETDFQLLIKEKFDIESELKSSLVFASYRNPYEIIEAEYKEEEENKTDLKEMLERFYELSKWMRSGKLAYCMDFNDPIQKQGLHNYNNLRNIILPLNFAFQRIGMRFDQIKPQTLIEALVPELKEKSKQASEVFEKVKEEKLNGEVKEDDNG